MLSLERWLKSHARITLKVRWCLKCSFIHIVTTLIVSIHPVQSHWTKRAITLRISAFFMKTMLGIHWHVYIQYLNSHRGCTTARPQCTRSMCFFHNLSPLVHHRRKLSRENTTPEAIESRGHHTCPRSLLASPPSPLSPFNKPSVVTFNFPVLSIFL